MFTAQQNYLIKLIKYILGGINMPDWIRSKNLHCNCWQFVNGESKFHTKIQIRTETVLRSVHFVMYI